MKKLTNLDNKKTIQNEITYTVQNQELTINIINGDNEVTYTTGIAGDHIDTDTHYGHSESFQYIRASLEDAIHDTGIILSNQEYLDIKQEYLDAIPEPEIANYLVFDDIDDFSFPALRNDSEVDCINISLCDNDEVSEGSLTEEKLKSLYNKAKSKITDYSDAYIEFNYAELA